ncbi:hypothetical protein JCM6882_003699 [Rhodosporidiobolus microsporus]
MSPSADLLVSPGTPTSSAGQREASATPAHHTADSSEPPPAKKTRAGKSCRRCRRFRSKCIHDTLRDKTPVAPCEACVRAGVGADCAFLPRGQSAEDRSYRRKRPREEDISLAPPLPTTPPLQPVAASPPLRKQQSDLLPPHDELVEGCKAFLSSYFQLGFISESVFLEQLEQDPSSISTFLLLAILTISARFSPSLVKRFGSRRAATEAFATRATELVPEEMLKPSLENVQAFFLLGVSEWGGGYGQKSWMLMGIAVRMAGLLRLHREDSYQLPPDAEPDEVVRSELARRTFWILVCHDNLTSGSHRPASFSPVEISALLPCDEEELAFGIPPSQRASLPGTNAATLNPPSALLPDRSLFASMITAHYLFGKVASLACSSETAPSNQPWLPTSDFSRLAEELRLYEGTLPPRHVWNLQNLRGMRAKKLDLALLSSSHIVRLAHIVLARIYLPSIAAAVEGSLPNDSAPPGFWTGLAARMAQDARELIAQVELFFSFRAVSEGFPPIMVFGLFAAGDLASYALRWPQLCPDLAPFAGTMVQRSLDLLAQLQEAWPVASRWYTTLAQSTTTFSAGDMTRTVETDRHRDVAEGLFRQEDEVTTSSPSRSSIPGSIPLPSPSLELGASTLLGLTVAPPPRPPPAESTSSLISPASQSNQTLYAPPPPPPPAPGPTYDPAALHPFPPASFAFAAASETSNAGDLMFFPDLGADLATFLQGDVQPAFTDEYSPDKPFLWQ